MADEVEVIVVDASVAAKWHLPDEEHTDRARMLLRRFAQGRTELVAPNYIRYEVPNALTVATQGRAPRITPAQGGQAIEEFLALGLTFQDEDGLITNAYDLVHRHGCALYDAFYVALAQQLSVPLLTADRRLYDRLRRLPYVTWLGDYAPTDSS